MIRWLLVGMMAWPLAGAEAVTLAGRAMGTSWRATFIPPAAGGDARDLERRLAGRLEQLEDVFSPYREHSELSRFNAADGAGWVSVPSELAMVARDSARISQLTGGAFDATVAPLLALWGFGPRGSAARLPRPDEIESARARVGWRLLEVRDEPPALRKARPGVTADFSSMAKGYAVEQMSALLSIRGVTRHLVQIGGDLKSAGDGGVGRGWKVGIERPDPAGAGIATTLVLREGQALSTSGDARNAVQLGDTRVGHILDPRTGRPVSSLVASASVAHISAATASALATAMFVLGADEGLRLAEANGWAVLFLVHDGARLEQRATPAFDALR